MASLFLANIADHNPAESPRRAADPHCATLDTWPSQTDSYCILPESDAVDSAGILGEPHATVDRALTGLLADGIVGRESHGTAHLPSIQRDYIAANGIGEPASPTGRRSIQIRTVSGIPALQRQSKP